MDTHYFTLAIFSGREISESYWRGCNQALLVRASDREKIKLLKARYFQTISMFTSGNNYSLFVKCYSRKLYIGFTTMQFSLN